MYEVEASRVELKEFHDIVKFTCFDDLQPKKMPRLEEGEHLVCIYGRGINVLTLVCESFADAQEIYQNYFRGGALHICWYRGRVLPAVQA